MRRKEERRKEEEEDGVEEDERVDARSGRWAARSPCQLGLDLVGRANEVLLPREAARAVEQVVERRLTWRGDTRSKEEGAMGE